MKLRIKKILGAGCQALRFGPTAARLRPGRFVILMFHRVVDALTMRASGNRPLMVEEGIFSRLARTLAEECLCLPLPEAIERSRALDVSDKPMVAITFDDGYAECYHKAFPILRRFGLPATIYLSTGYIDDPQRIFWWDAVEEYVVNHLNQDELLDLGLPRGFLRKFFDAAWTSAPDMVEAFIRGPLVQLRPSERKAFLDLAQETASSRPDILTWDQVREMAMSGLVEFGAHTVNHPYLDELPYEDALQEILTSKQRIEAETDRPVWSLAYPSGRVPGCRESMLARAGIGHAVTTRHGGNDALSDPFLLRRVDARFGMAGEEFIPAYFKALCWGCLDWLH
jgi:peptidoglycan/xylan/chitin deacetylase (PgdA/CDA1 family)